MELMFVQVYGGWSGENKQVKYYMYMDISDSVNAMEKKTSECTVGRGCYLNQDIQDGFTEKLTLGYERGWLRTWNFILSDTENGGRVLSSNMI